MSARSSSNPRIFSRFDLIAGSATFASVALLKASAKAAQFEFKCGSYQELDHPTTVRMTQMWAAIKRESGGRINTQFFPNSILGTEAARLAQLRLGALQFNLTPPSGLGAVVPASEITSVGFAFKDGDEGLRALDGGLGDYIRQETGAKGLFSMRTYWDDGMYQVGTVPHAIRTVDDLRGFKIRVSGKIAVDLFKELGASPTPIPYTEVYTGLQTKLIDGEAAPLMIIETSRFFEVNKYVSLTNHALSGEWLLANGDVWKSLPPDLRAVIERNNTKYATLERRDMKIMTAAVTDKLTRQGLAVNKVDPASFRTRLRSYYGTQADAFGATEWALLETAIGTKLR